MLAGSGSYFLLFSWSTGLHPAPSNANEKMDEPKTGIASSALVDGDSGVRVGQPHEQQHFSQPLS